MFQLLSIFSWVMALTPRSGPDLFWVILGTLALMAMIRSPYCTLRSDGTIDTNDPVLARRIIASAREREREYR